MRVRTARVGMEVVDKIEGIRYAVTETSTDGGVVTAAKATEILDEDEPEKEPRKVEITEKNDITFSVTKWVQDTDVPTGFSVENGKLVKNGQPVTEMGSIEALKVVRAFPGRIIFTAKSDNDEVKKVMAYIPSRDKFDTLGGIDKIDYELVEESETRSVYAYCTEKKVKKENENGETEEIDVLDQAGVIVLTPQCVSIAAAEDYLGESERLELKRSVVFSENGKEVFFRIVNTDWKKAEPGKYMQFHVTNRANTEDVMEFPGELTGVSRNRAARQLSEDVYTGRNFIKVGRYLVKHDGLARLAEDGYKFVVDFHESEGGFEFVMATKDREVTTVTNRHTPDRGEIVTIS